MPAPYERRALAFDGKPVIVFVDGPSRIGRPFLARCHGATLSAEEERVSEDTYIERILQTATDMGLAATLTRRDDHQLAFEVTVPKR